LNKPLGRFLGLIVGTAALAGACTDEVVYDLTARKDASAAGSGGTGGGSDASTTDAGGTGGSSGTAGSDAADAASEGGSLTLCVRLGSELQVRAELTAFFTAYASRIRRSCDVTLFTDRALERFANQLAAFNSSLWGCVSAPPTSFGIIETGSTLTVKDVAAFIELYMEVARLRLSLSPSEERIMQAELERLGALAVNSPDNTLTYALPNCDAGARDAGAADSADGDAPQTDDAGADASSDGAAE
jgi:hypothetical protein